LRIGSGMSNAGTDNKSPKSPPDVENKADGNEGETRKTQIIKISAMFGKEKRVSSRADLG